MSYVFTPHVLVLLLNGQLVFEHFWTSFTHPLVSFQLSESLLLRIGFSSVPFLPRPLPTASTGRPYFLIPPPTNQAVSHPSLFTFSFRIFSFKGRVFASLTCPSVFFSKAHTRFFVVYPFSSSRVSTIHDIGGEVFYLRPSFCQWAPRSSLVSLSIFPREESLFLSRIERTAVSRTFSALSSKTKVDG